MAAKTEQYSTKAQRQTIMGSIGYDDDTKKQLALEFSNGRTDSLRALFLGEASFLIKRLKRDKAPRKTPRNLQFDRRIKRHRYILSLCISLGWSKEHPRSGEIACMKTFDKWLKGNKSPVKEKHLIDLEDKELTKVIYALEQILS